MPYAVKELDIKAKAVGATGEGVKVNDIETINITLNSNTEQYPIIGETFDRAVKTGMSLELALEGKFNDSDPGQKLMLDTWDKVGAAAELTISVVYPSGAKYEITGPVGIDDFGGGGANDIGAFSATINSNGAPVFTPAPVTP